MPSLKEVRTRIVSVKSTQKITRAMKLVAAAKLKRAQDAIVAARPYAEGLSTIVSELAARTPDSDLPLLRRPTGDRTLLLPLTSDRGLCGGFNSSVCKLVQTYCDDHSDREISIDVVGRKGNDFFKRRELPIGKSFPAVVPADITERSRELALTVTEKVRKGEVDRVFLVYNEFKSALVQTPRFVPIVPVEPAAVKEDSGQSDFAYEPDRESLLSTLLPLYLESQIAKAVLESIASEFGARMTAMDSATTNASDMIDRLTLQYNRARQATITKELMEIVGGAEALKG